MPLPRFRIRTLMIAVAVVAMILVVAPPLVAILVRFTVARDLIPGREYGSSPVLRCKKSHA
jgi:hypothetical protein